MNTARFDSSLIFFVETLLEFVTPEVLGESAFIRDINGQLGVILATSLPIDDQEKITNSLKKKLGAYARPYALVADEKSFDAPALLDEARTKPAISVGGQLIRLLDRRAVGLDWLNAPPASQPGSIPCIVFASIKGGVGRSTALSVAAAHLSRRGRRVLAIDFDLEAPGIGSMLLKENELPRFGSLDFLVESQVSGFDATFIEELIGSSYLGAAGARVDVIPAIGSNTLEHPQNALGKIARAYLEMQSEDEGQIITLGGKLKKLVQFCVATGRYDVILVDSRAGLHESSAGSMLALGGEVLLFGTNQPQTFQGYTLLFAHLAQFPVDPNDDWRERLNFVHAMSSPNEKARKDAADRFADMYRFFAPKPAFPTSSQDTAITAEDIDIVWDDSLKSDPLVDTLDCEVLHVLNDRNYLDFDPITRRDLLESSSYEHTYSDLIDYLDQTAANAETT